MVPITTTIRGSASELVITQTTVNGLFAESAAEGQHVRAVPMRRVSPRRGNVGSDVLLRIRTAVTEIIDAVG